VLISVLHAQTYEATIQLTVVGDSLDVAMYLQHTGTSSPVLGNCSFFINFNKNGLTNPRLKEDGEWDGDHQPGYGQNLLNVNLSLGLASIEVVKSGNPTYEMPNTPTHLGTLRFKITNPAQNAGITWNATYLEVFDNSYTNITPNGTFINPPDISLPVCMTSFFASLDERGGVLLKWITQTEVNSAGFYVWRSENEETGYVRITTLLIPSHGNSASPQEYTFTDLYVEEGKTYWYRIEEVSLDGKSTFFGPVSVSTLRLVPTCFSLSQNYPNPFNPVTTMRYGIPEQSKVKIVVYSLMGRKIKTLLDEFKLPGQYQITWDGTDGVNQKVSSGIYVIKMEAGDFSTIRKVTLLR